MLPRDTETLVALRAAIKAVLEHHRVADGPAEQVVLAREHMHSMCNLLGDFDDAIVNELYNALHLPKVERRTAELRPDYYDKDDPYEPWKIIKAHKLDFWTGNVLKYLLRAGKKPGQSKEQDLRKALTYLAEALRIEEKQHGNQTETQTEQPSHGRTAQEISGEKQG